MTNTPSASAGPRPGGSGRSAAPEDSAAPEESAGPVEARLAVADAAAMRGLGRRLAALLRPGDLVLLTGELGAGKTTLTRGIGEGLGVRGAVTSPTFVIARVHPPLAAGPALVHADAYRLAGGLEEMEDLDLDVSLPDSVVVVEWGEGRVEELAEERLHVVIHRPLGGEHGEQGSGAGSADAAEPREVTLTGVGARWRRAELAELA